MTSLLASPDTQCGPELVPADLEDPRTRIAFAVLGVVARFAGQPLLVDQARDEHIGCRPGETPALAAERLVRELGDEAEGVTLGHTVVSATLADRYLLDDYLRIRAVEQCDAFGDDLTEDEKAAAVARGEELADQREKTRADTERTRREDARVCRGCGETFKSHRPSADTYWTSRARGCGNFRDLGEADPRIVQVEHVRTGWRWWLLDNAVRLDSQQTEQGEEAVVRMVENSLSGAGTAPPKVYDLYAAALAAVI